MYRNKELKMFVVRWLVFSLPVALGLALYVGYYEKIVEANFKIIPFIKKHPTFQVKFYNLHANDGDIRVLEYLTAEQRKLIIDYCRYRLGVETDLKTQEDVEVCSKK